MKAAVHLLLSVILLCACSTDKLNVVEEAVVETLEDSTSDPVDTPVDTPEENTDTSYFMDSFDTEGPLVDYVTNNASALPDVSSVSGRYLAVLEDNTDNVTLHFNMDQGRIDAKLLSFPFTFIARNIGIGTMDDSQAAPVPNNGPYLFSGVQVHDTDFNSINSSHVVVGHRGNTGYTVEGKNTLNGDSSVNDIGANTVPDGRGDIRIVGNADRSLTVYWQRPNLDFENTEDDWTLYNGTGTLPGTAPSYGAEVYVGLITYAFGQNGVPFVGTCDAIEIWD